MQYKQHCYVHTTLCLCVCAKKDVVKDAIIENIFNLYVVLIFTFVFKLYYNNVGILEKTVDRRF